MFLSSLSSEVFWKACWRRYRATEATLFPSLHVRLTPRWRLLLPLCITLCPLCSSWHSCKPWVSSCFRLNWFQCIVCFVIEFPCSFPQSVSPTAAPLQSQHPGFFYVLLRISMFFLLSLLLLSPSPSFTICFLKIAVLTADSTDCTWYPVFSVAMDILQNSF